MVAGCSASKPQGLLIMYLWVKAFHLIAMVAWMASLLIYPRYKLHQAKSQAGDSLFDTMQTASKQLRSIIMIPSMIATWVLGIALIALNPSVFQLKFMWVKLLLVAGVTVLHIYFTKVGRALDAGEGSVSVNKLRMLNELPFIALIIIVIMVVVKPF